MVKNKGVFILIAFFLSGAPCFAGLMDGLISHWSFDNLVSPGNDDSGNGRHATVFGTTSVPGISGNALSYDGIDDYVTVTDADAFTPLDTLSLSFWINKQGNSSVDTGHTGIYKAAYSHNDRSYYMRIDPGTGQVQWRFFSPNPAVFDTVESSTAIEFNAWYHVTTVFDQGVASIFINGVLDTSQTFPVVNTIFNDPHDLTLGAVFSHSTNPPHLANFLYGMLDEVRLYDRALSGDEVSQLYLTPVPTPSAVLLGVFGLVAAGCRLRRGKTA